MLQNTVERAILAALFITYAAFVVGCGQSGGGNTGGGGPASSSSTGEPSGGTGTGGTGAGGNGCASSCDDGFACTFDACTNGVCMSVIGPNDGPTACPPGQYCTLDHGCIAAPPCATRMDCVEAWRDDACKADIACDPVTSTCTFKPLDKDEDGHAPPVCGGDDCNDDNQGAYPGAQEVCDGVDQDCNPTNEAEARCSYPYHLCTEQSSPEIYLCVCDPAEVVCPGTCGPINFTTDERHCGNCDTECPSGVTCEGGVCTCPGGLTFCGDRCVDTSIDSAHCGGCDAPCALGATCTGAACTCSGGLVACAGGCVNTATDEQHCGGCNSPCTAPTPTCIGGICTGGCDPPCDPALESCSMGVCEPLAACGSECGNGIVEADCGEECDDGNLNNGDGCSSDCRNE